MEKVTQIQVENDQTVTINDTLLNDSTTNDPTTNVPTEIAHKEDLQSNKVRVLVLVLVQVDYLAGLQEEHNAKVELSTTN